MILNQREVNQRWHEALNIYNCPKEHFYHFMYEAKTASHELKRMILLFGDEREGKLTKIHRQCSRSLPEEVIDNHLTCALGVECRKCPHLQALDKMGIDEISTDEIKAWTCLTHIISEGGDKAGDGYLITEDDKIYWKNVNESMAQQSPFEEETK